MSNHVREVSMIRAIGVVCLTICLFVIAGGCSSHPQQPAAHSSKYTTLESKQQACERGEVAECSEVGLAYMKGEGVAKDKERGLMYLRKGCDGKVSAACFGLGVNQLMGGNGAEDVVKGVANIKQACDDKHGPACFFLGTIADGLVQIPGMQPNKELAKSYYKKGCAYGHKESCSVAE